MTMHKRQWLLGAACGALALAVGPVAAQGAGGTASAWPTRTVRMVVPSPAGTAPDIVARIIGDRLQRIWGQSVVVENRPGAGGVVAFTSLKTSEKDDHQLTFVPASTVTLTPFMYKSVNVNIPRDLTPVAYIGDSPMVLAANENVPWKTFAEFVAAAKKAPDTIIVSSPVEYSVPNLTTDLLARRIGAKLRSIPYAGSAQSTSAAVGGDAQAVIDGMPPLEGMLKGNRLRLLATFSKDRLPNYPDVPAVAETYPDMVINGWFGIFAVTGLNPAIIEKVNKDVSSVIVQPDLAPQFQQLAMFPRPMSVAKFSELVSAERKRWEQALRDVGAKPAALQ